MSPVCRAQIQKSAWCAEGKEVIVVHNFKQAFVFLKPKFLFVKVFVIQTPFIVATLSLPKYLSPRLILLKTHR